MKITVIGTGNMARAIATRSLRAGHEVEFVGRFIGQAAELADEMVGEGSVGASEEVDGELVVLAVPYSEAPNVVRQHADRLDGRVVIDITNPVDLSVLEPLTGDWIEPFNSGAELIAAEVPEQASLVKAFNTTFPGPLLVGELDGHALDVFIAGDDEEAKAKVAQLVRDMRLRPIDAGALNRARELEALGFLHMAIQPSLGTHFGSAVKVLPDRLP